MAAFASNWAIRTSFTWEPTGGILREATKTNRSQSKRFSGEMISTSGKALYSQGREICPISNSHRAVIWSDRSQIPMEEITSPPSSFSPVSRVEPTSPMARRFTRFFPSLGEAARRASHPARPGLTAVSRPSVMAADRAGSASTQGRREASSASSPWPASSWPGWFTRNEPRPRTGSPGTRAKIGPSAAGSVSGPKPSRGAGETRAAPFQR